jgi:hypothetical protein
MNTTTILIVLGAVVVLVFLRLRSSTPQWLPAVQPVGAPTTVATVPPSAPAPSSPPLPMMIQARDLAAPHAMILDRSPAKNTILPSLIIPSTWAH